MEKQKIKTEKKELKIIVDNLDIRIAFVTPFTSFSFGIAHLQKEKNEKE